jgi:hypothetical protein
MDELPGLSIANHFRDFANGTFKKDVPEENETEK